MADETTESGSVPSDSKFPWYLALIGVYAATTLLAENRRDCHENLKSASLTDMGMLALGA